MVLVTNEVNQTYFSGPAWRAFAERYEMIADQNLVLWIEEGDDAIIFDPPEPGDNVSLEQLSLDGSERQAVVVADLSP
jgi:hypothetical protein